MTFLRRMAAKNSPNADDDKDKDVNGKNEVNL